MSSIKAIALGKIVGGGGGGGGDVSVVSLTATENNTYAAGDEGKIVVGGELIDQPAQGVNF